MISSFPSLPFGHLSQRESIASCLSALLISPFGRYGVARAGYFLLKLFAFFRFSKFGIIIAVKMMITPIQRKKFTCSCKTKADMLTATGSSAELSIELKVKPILGMPEAKHNGGITVPNIAKINPHFNKLLANAPLNKNVGGSTMKINKQAPVIINALFCKGGYSLPKLPLSIKNMA